MDLDFVSVHKLAKRELGQYPAILTSHLVNNPYIFSRQMEAIQFIDVVPFLYLKVVFQKMTGFFWVVW